MSAAETLDRPEISLALVRRLVATQFPHWAGLPITPVAVDGWDNRTFHLGSEMSVRLPSGPNYALQVEKEQYWLPRLTPQLPLAIPTPLARGEPAEGYPWCWSIYRWIAGETAEMSRIGDPVRFAEALAGFLVALQRAGAEGGPLPGRHNFFRGGPPAVYDGETRAALAELAGEIDVPLATEVWEAALGSSWQNPPVWFHGDIASGNLLVREGELAAVIDFGTSGIGDPACDLAIAWTLLDGESREAFRAGLPLDADTWARGRGWTLWKALIVLAARLRATSPAAEEPRRVIAAVLDDHQRLG